MFGAAALFNFAVAAQLAAFEARGPKLTIVAVASALVATFGYAYLRVAQDHRRYRPLIELGVVGKSAAVAAILTAGVAGSGGGAALVLAASDAVFVVLFVRFLRMTRADRRD